MPGATPGAVPFFEDEAMPTEEKGPKKGSRAKIEIEGEVPADTVDKALKLRAPDDVSTRDKDRRRFATAIKDPNVRIVGKRLSPSRGHNGEAL